MALTPGFGVPARVIVGGLLAACLALAAPAPALAQASADSAATALRVFLDCDLCDMPYFQTEVPFVSFVRDRAVADVHLLVTDQKTGAGGSEYTLTFIGRGTFAGVNDTLRLVTKPGETDQQENSRAAQRIRLGLVRYLARVPTGEGLKISGAAVPGGTAAPRRDPWSGWVFGMRVNGFFNGQSGQRAIWANGSLRASRVTARDKWSFNLSANYNENRYDLSGFKYFSASRSQYGSARYVFPLRDHWSGALSARATSSTFENIGLRVGGGPAIEYDLFPYTESTRRQLRFDYELSVAHWDYQRLTIYEKTSETTAREEFSVILQSREPWGSSRASVELSNYFHDLERNRVEANGQLSLRLAEGLSLDLGGAVSRVRDQLSLAAAGATQEEILLQRRQLQTDYTYYANVGLRYTFGSIFNPAVNARFGDD